MAQWIPLHDLPENDYRTVLQTFSSVFEHSVLFLANNYSIIIGSQKSIQLDNELFDKLTSGSRQIKKELSDIGVTKFQDVNELILLKDDHVRRFSEDAAVSRLNLSTLEFSRFRMANLDNTIVLNLKEIIEYRQDYGYRNSRLDSYLHARVLYEQYRLEEVSEYIISLPADEVSAELRELDLRVRELEIRNNVAAIGAMEDLDEAIQLLESYIDLFPEKGTYYYLLGFTYFKQGDTQLARKYISRSIELSPFDKDMLERVHSRLVEQKEYELALVAIERLLELDKNNNRYKRSKLRLQRLMR